MWLRRFSCLLLAFAVSACATAVPPSNFSARQIAFEQIPGWPDDNYPVALQSFIAGCSKLSRTAVQTSPGSGLSVPPAVWQSLCADAQATPPEQARIFFERRFVPYRISDSGREDGLFTGYYEPLLSGSRHKGGSYIYPVYARPPEQTANNPYFTRQQINHGALAGRHLELLWVNDPVMLFFMQVQGSGRVKLAEGGTLRLGFDGKNGQPYVSLGKIMGDEGLLPKGKIDFFTIRQWLYQHPAQAQALMERNPTYVFFHILPGNAPIGAAGVGLTPNRSLAVDNNFIPYGLPLFLETTLPQPDGSSWPYRRLMLAQDTGVAIKGAVRGDIFFGGGSKAEYYAGAMKGRGVTTLLVPKEITGQLP